VKEAVEIATDPASAVLAGMETIVARVADVVANPNEVTGARIANLPRGKV
jgi:hypothetical protein